MSNVVSCVMLRVRMLLSNVVSPWSTANVLKLTVPAMSPVLNKVNPCGNLLLDPDTIRYCNSRPIVLMAATTRVLTLPLLIVPKSAGVSQVATVSRSPM